MGLFTREDSPFWWMYLEGLRKKVNTRIPVGEGAARRDQRAKALQAYNKAMGDLASGRFDLPTDKPARTFRQHARWYDANLASHHRGKLRERSMINALIDHFLDRPLTALTAADIEEWKTARVRAVAKSTVNRELEILKPLLRSAVPTYIQASPADVVKKFRLRRFPPITILSDSAEAALLAVASPTERAFVLLGLDAILRQTDARTLRLEHNHGTHLDITDPKTSVPYKVPASRRLKEALSALTPRDGWYFWKSRVGKRKGEIRPWSPSEAFKVFADLCERAKVPCGRKVGGITYHALRHTGATRAARAVKLTAVMRLGGWASLTQLVRYDHPDDSELIRAVEAIGGSRPVPARKQKRKILKFSA